jgi:hypothetical protein
LIAVLPVLTACASTGASSPQRLDIVGASIENQTRGWVSTARIGVPAIGRFVSCGNIAPGAECATAFPELTYSGNPVEFTWSQGEQVWTTGEVGIQPDEEVLTAGRAIVRVVIVSPGSAGVTLLPLSRP